MSTTISEVLVLDLTFRDISCESDLQSCLEDQLKLRENSGSRSPSKRAVRDDVKAVKLSNNNIADICDIVSPITNCLFISNIAWLDLSVNNIQSINSATASLFPNLTTLYLHGNQISKLSEFRKLNAFPHLKSVTFFGNPVEEHKHYRNMVLFCCPNLIQLDFSTITKLQRDQVQTWSSIYRKKLFPDEDF
eukprot:gene3309-6551_t